MSQMDLDVLNIAQCCEQGSVDLEHSCDSIFDQLTAIVNHDAIVDHDNFVDHETVSLTGTGGDLEKNHVFLLLHFLFYLDSCLVQ